MVETGQSLLRTIAPKMFINSVEVFLAQGLACFDIVRPPPNPMLSRVVLISCSLGVVRGSIFTSARMSFAKCKVRSSRSYRFELSVLLIIRICFGFRVSDFEFIPVDLKET